MGQAWRANVLGEVKKEAEFDASQKLSTRMDSTKECGTYQRPRETSEAESRPAADKNRTRKSNIGIRMGDHGDFEGPFLPSRSLALEPPAHPFALGETSRVGCNK